MSFLDGVKELVSCARVGPALTTDLSRVGWRAPMMSVHLSLLLSVPVKFRCVVACVRAAAVPKDPQ